MATYVWLCCTLLFVILTAVKSISQKLAPNASWMFRQLQKVRLKSSSSWRTQPLQTQLGQTCDALWMVKKVTLVKPRPEMYALIPSKIPLGFTATERLLAR